MLSQVEQEFASPGYKPVIPQNCAKTERQTGNRLKAFFPYLPENRTITVLVLKQGHANITWCIYATQNYNVIRAK